MSSTRARPLWGAWIGTGLIALVLGYLLRTLATDDPFITYRYAANLARGAGFVYAPGSTTLSTTTPLYALLLGVLGRVWDNLPLVSNAVGAFSIWATAALLGRLGTRQSGTIVGLGAALFFVLFPLGWLSLGFEAAFYLLLVTAAFTLYQSRAMGSQRGEIGVGLLLGLATLTRFDAVIPCTVFGLHFLATRRRIPWMTAAAYLVTLAPLAIWLAWRYGSPLPATLAAKQAQQTLGITGFYPDTTYLHGFTILVRAWLAQAGLHLLWVALALVGLVAGLRRLGWLWLWVLWAAAHCAVYALLGTTPYFWHYMPLAPALALLAATGLEVVIQLATRVAPHGRGLQTGVALLLGALLLLPLAVSDRAIVQALEHPNLPPPTEVASKVLPEAKVDTYREVGRWLANATPPDALIGVTEVGVIGYYAQRPMVDFLGLLDARVAQSLARGDLGWALAVYLPDYVALTAVNPLYSYDLTADRTFYTLYTPVQRFVDPRFWGSPVTVYRLDVPRHLAGDVLTWAPPNPPFFDEQLALTAVRAPSSLLSAPVTPGDRITLELDWQARRLPDADHALFAHLVGQEELIAAQFDRPLLAQENGRYAKDWPVGAVYRTRADLTVPATAFVPDALRLRLGLYTPADGTRLTLADGGDHVPLPWELSLAPEEVGQTPLEFGGQMALVGYRIEGTPRAMRGGTLAVGLAWQAQAAPDDDYKVFVHLVDRVAGNRIAQDDGRPGQDDRSTQGWTPGEVQMRRHLLTVPVDAPPGVYDVWVGLYSAASGERLFVLDAVGNPRADHVRLGPVRIAEQTP